MLSAMPKRVVPKAALVPNAQGQSINSQPAKQNNIKYTIQVEAKQPVLQPQYKIRWIKADGSIISKIEYNAAKLQGELVYIAAFVGCTYHCG